MICNNCGFSIPAGETHCPKCKAEATSPFASSSPNGSSTASSTGTPQFSTFQFSWNKDTADAPKNAEQQNSSNSNSGSTTTSSTPEFQFSWQKKGQTELGKTPSFMTPEPQPTVTPQPPPPPVAPPPASALNTPSTPPPVTPAPPPHAPIPEPAPAPPPPAPIPVPAPVPPPVAPAPPPPSPIFATEPEPSKPQPRVVRKTEPRKQPSDDQKPEISSTVPPAPTPYEGPDEPPTPASSNLVWAWFNILGICICCLSPCSIIGGIMALVFIKNARKLYQRGMITDGLKYENYAFFTNILTTVLNILWGLFFVINSSEP